MVQLTSSTKKVETATEAGKSIVDGLISEIDAIAYTDEEKAEAHQKGLELSIKYSGFFSAKTLS